MPAVALLVNFFFPGFGTLIIGKTGVGVTQIILAITAGLIFLFIPIIGWIVAIPLGLGNWVWALVSSVTPKAREEIRYRR